MSRKDPPALTDPYAPGSERPPAPDPKRGSLPSVPNLPPPRLPSSPNLGDRMPSHPSIPEITVGRSPSLTSSPDLRSSASYPGTPPPPIAGQSEPHAEVTPKKKSALGWILGAIGGLVVLGAATAGGLWWFKLRAPPVLPFEVGSLPESTVAVGRNDAGAYTFGLTRDELPPEATWSFYAETLCGGTDVFRALMRPSRKYLRFGLAEALAERRQLSAALACGRDLANKETGRSYYWVTIKVPDDRPSVPSPLDRPDRDKKDAKAEPKFRNVEVYLYGIDLAKLPDTTKRYREHRDRSGLESTHCLAGDRESKNDNECQEYARASAHLEGTKLWVAASVSALAVFGKDFSPQGTNKLEDQAVWSELIDQVKAYPSAQIGTHETFDDGFLFQTGLAVALYDNKELGESAKRIRETVTKYSARWTVGDSIVSAEGGELRLELVAPGESEAIDLLLDVKEWQAELKERLEKLDDAATEDKEAEGLKRAERDYYRVLHKAAIRSIKDPLIERDGKRVRVVFTVSYDEDEKQKLAAMHDLARERAALAAKVISSLTAGDKPDESLLRDIGGSDLVEILKDPEKARKDFLKE